MHRKRLEGISIIKRHLLLALAALSLPNLAAAQAGSVEPGVITYLVIGSTDPDKKVPALDAVPYAGVSNVAVPMPVRTLRHGGLYTVTFGVQDGTYQGSCTASITLGTGTDGSGQIYNASTYPFNCSASQVWTFPFATTAIPNTPGPALLTATMQFGSYVRHAKIRLTIQ